MKHSLKRLSRALLGALLATGLMATGIPAASATDAASADSAATATTSTEATPTGTTTTSTQAAPAEDAPAEATTAQAAPANAAPSNYGQDSSDSAQSIAVNQWVSGSLTDDGDQDWYKVQTPSTGVISLSFSNEQRQNGNWGVKLFDPDLNEYYTYTYEAKSTSHDATTRIAVPAGTYFVQVYYPGDWHQTYTDARYSLKFNFTKTTTWETEHNDQAEKATPLAVNTGIYGTLTTSGDQDWYKVQTPSTGVISLSFSNEQRQNGNWGVKLFDPDLNEYYTYTYEAKSTSHDATTRIAVPAGTYFVQVYYPGDWHQTYTDARYSLKFNFTKTTTWETEHNDQAEKATPLRVNTTINGTLYTSGDEDWYRFGTPTTDALQILFSNEQRQNGNWGVKLYDANLNELRTYGFTANETSHAADPITVSAGTYFVQVYYPGDWHQTYTDARYSLNVKFGTKGTVTFVSNGGSSVPSQTVKYGSKARKPADPKRTGYIFRGWYTRDGKKYDFGLPVNSNVTLYAHWSGRQYIIYFDANHGKASAKDKKVTMGAKYGNLPTASRAGYRFLGWYTKQGNKVTSQTTVGMASNRTFVAHWAPRQYTIYFDGNHGTPSARKKTVTYHAKYGTLPTAWRSGYRFVGWYTKQGNRVTSQTIVGMASNRTFVAHWVKIQHPYVREDNKPGIRPYLAD